MKKVRFSRVLAMLLCFVMAWGVVPERVLADDVAIEFIRLDILHNELYVDGGNIDVFLYHNNVRIVSSGPGFGSFVDFSNPGFRVSQISELEIRIFLDYDHLALANIPLSDFTHYSLGRLHMAISMVEDIDNPYERLHLLSAQHINNPLETIRVTFLSTRISYSHGIRFLSDYSIGGITVALYHNNVRIGEGTGIYPDLHHSGVSFENLGLTYTQLENLELQVIDWGGHISSRSVMPLRYSRGFPGRGATERTIRWYIFDGDLPLTVTTPPTAQVSPQPQAVTQPSPWAIEQIATAIAEGLVPQNLQSNYTHPTTRAEFAALATALYETVTGSEITGRASFNDTTDINVQKMGYLGVVTGVGGGNFAPNDTLTREQAAVMLARLADAIGQPLSPSAPTFADNAQLSAWATDAVGQMQASGIMGGVGNNQFAPNGDYTREQSIVTILRLFEILS